MHFCKNRPGTSLLELVMFMAFFAIAASAVLVLLFGTNEQRIRQEGIALVDQTGIQLLQTITRRIRAAERILDPSGNSSGNILALQMAAEADNPTILASQSGTLFVGEYDTTFPLTSSGQVTVQNFWVRNTSPSDDTPSVQVSFTIQKYLGIPSQPSYSRTFETLITLFPDDEQQGNSCACALPTCNAGVYEWEYCNITTCEIGPAVFPCQ